MRWATGLGVVLALMLTAAPASAFLFNERDLNAPWCLAYSGTDGIVECSYYTFEECMETMWGVGGSCQPNYNTRYAKEPAPRDRRPRRR